MRPRDGSYVWPTWLASLLSGDSQCEWAAWLKAHFHYDRLPASSNLLRWKAEHADLVRRRAEELRSAGWSVTVEQQNKFVMRGREATLGGCPDIVALRDGQARIEDCKTGQPRDSDAWQVAVYVLALTLPGLRCATVPVVGSVVYRSGPADLSADFPAAAKDRIISRILTVATGPEPPRTPSAWECARCDIAMCPDRQAAEPDATATDAF